MYLLKKENTTLGNFKPLHNFFLKTLNHGYGDFLGGIPECFFEGFEWDKPFELELNSDLNNFITTDMIRKPLPGNTTPSVKSSVKQLASAIKNKLKF